MLHRRLHQTTIYIDEDLYYEAKKQGLNISEFLRKSLIMYMNKSDRACSKCGASGSPVFWRKVGYICPMCQTDVRDKQVVVG